MRLHWCLCISFTWLFVTLSYRFCWFIFNKFVVFVFLVLNNDTIVRCITIWFSTYVNISFSTLTLKKKIYRFVISPGFIIKPFSNFNLYFSRLFKSKFLYRVFYEYIKHWHIFIKNLIFTKVYYISQFNRKLASVSVALKVFVITLSIIILYLFATRVCLFTICLTPLSFNDLAI